MIGPSFKTGLYLKLLLASMIILVVNEPSYCAEFEIDEIVSAIKQEIQTARATESGRPNFEIDSVDVQLAIVSDEKDRGGLAIKVAGFEYGDLNETLKLEAYHKLNFNFKPRGTSDFTAESTLGLVDAIKKVKASFRKAYNNPPRFAVNGFTFELEFAIEKRPDGGVGFQIIDLGFLKAQSIATHKIKIHMVIKN